QAGPWYLHSVPTRRSSELSVIRALDSAGTAVSNPAYFPRNAYGALAGITGSGGVPLGGVGYAGAATPNARGGFVYFRNRWYDPRDRKSTRLNSSHVKISYA